MVQAFVSVTPAERAGAVLRWRPGWPWPCVGLTGILLLAGCAATGPGRTAGELRGPVSGMPAVVALADNARQAMAGGHPESAAASLERALRLEPRNPRLWYRLARVRLSQRRDQDAESLASKAISLSGDPVLTAAAWRAIAAARRAHGDIPGARAADRQAARAEHQ